MSDCCLSWRVLIHLCEQAAQVTKVQHLINKVECMLHTMFF